MNWTISQTVDLSRGYTPVVWPDALMVSEDVGAHTWRVKVLDGGVPADLSGAAVTGYFVREDGVTVAVAGSVSGHTVSVTLAQNCYAVPGRLGGVMRMVVSGKTVTLSSVIFTVKRLTTDSMVDPGRAFFTAEALTRLYDELAAQMQSLASGSPKGVFASLTALQAAKPDGDTGIYVVSADGKWYYWDGSAWAAGGVYQSDRIALKSISRLEIQDEGIGASQLDFVKTSPNLFDPQSATLGYVYAVGASAPSVSANHAISDWIEVTPGETYSYDRPHRVTYFDAVKSYKGYQNIESVKSWAVPADVVWARVSVSRLNNYHLLAQVVRGDLIPPFTPYQIPRIDPSKIKAIPDGGVDGEAIQDKAVSMWKTDFITPATNLFDISRRTERHRIGLTGELEADDTYNTSDFIRVHPATDLSTYGILHAAEFDKDREFIQRVTLDYSGASFTTHPRTSFLRLNWQVNSSFLNRRLNYGSVLMDFTEPIPRFSKSAGLEALNKTIDDYQTPPMIDVPIDEVFESRETYPDYTGWGSTTYSDVYAIYDALVSAYPGYVSRQLIGNAFGMPVYVYTFFPELPTTMGPVRLPKVFITTGVHGAEKASVLSTALMCKQMCERWQDYPMLEAIRHNVNLIVMPVVNPYGYNAGTRVNGNDVDLNRNCPWGWRYGNEGTNQYSGPSPGSEAEVQYFLQVLSDNPDIDVYFDFHNFFATEGTTRFLMQYVTSPVMDNVSRCLIGRMHRLWSKRYSFVEMTHDIGWSLRSTGGQFSEQGDTVTRLSSTLEICRSWGLDPNGGNYDENVCRSGVEAVVNYILLNIRELGR